MTGMDVVIELRLAKLKPAAVFVYLVHHVAPNPCPMGPSGIVSVDIPMSDSLASLDFRPLVGLTVHIVDTTGSRDRHRKAAAMVAAVDPELLVMPVSNGDQLLVHRRIAGTPAQTETIRL